MKGMIITNREREIIRECLAGENELYRYPALMVKLTRHYEDEMPYGTQKARDGDPDVWLLDRVQQDL